jgi:hypothetical protein
MITRRTSRVRCPYPFAGRCDALLPLQVVVSGEWRVMSGKVNNDEFSSHHHVLLTHASLDTRHSPVLTIRCFGIPLSPVHYRRRAPRPVSYYALFKWWLLLSQHPGCLRSPTSFRTQRSLGTLAGGLGCSPLDDEAYPPPSICLASPRGIRSLVRKGSRVGPLSDSVALPPRVSARR